MTKLSKKKRILLFLKENGRSSTTKIAMGIGSAIAYTNKYLHELLKIGRVKREQETGRCYWVYVPKGKK